MSNSKEITIYDIAKELNVSAATVSRGLKDHPSIGKDTKKKIVDVARRLGYRQNVFASNLRKKKTNTIGVIVPRLNSNFMSTVISGIEKHANKAGYNLIISQSLESIKKEVTNLNTMYDTRVDGVLLSLAADTRNNDHLQALINKQIPVILFDRVIETPDCTSIIIDNFKAAHEMTRHLIGQGCQRIAHVTNDINCKVYQERLNGYVHALKQAGLPVDNHRIIECDLSEQSGIVAAKKLMEQHPRPDGIFFTNDTSAVSCMMALQEMQIRIPEEVAVAGFNNDLIARVIQPNLTTIDYPGQEMGERAISTLLKLLKEDGKSKTETITLQHQLIERASTRRAK